MKKSKFLLLITILLILLIGLAIFVQGNKKEDTDKTTDTDTIVAAQSNIEITNYTNDQISKLEITEGENHLSFIKDGENWCIEGLDSSDNLNTAAIKVLCDNLLKLDAFKKIDSSNLDDFGLAKPSKVITYTLADGSVSRVSLGSTTPNNKSVYLLKESTNEIFLITSSMANSFKGDLTAFRTTQLDTIDTSTVTALRASGRDIDSFDIYLNTETQDYTTSYLLKLKDGSIRDVSTNNFLALLKLIPSPITIENFIADKVTDLSPYGLDNPALDLYIENSAADTNQATSIHYLWGDTKEDGQVYFMKADTQSVYSMSSDFLKPLLDSFDPFTLSAKFTQLTNVSDVLQIDMTLPEGHYTLNIDGENYTLNDKALPADTFKALYKSIIGIYADTEFKNTALPNDTPAVSFTFTSPEGEKTTYNYYSYDNQFYLTQFKGQSIAGCSIKQFTYLKDCLDKALSNQ